MITKIAFAVVAIVATYPSSQQFEMSRYSIDSGGATRSTGGQFELSGTIGQSDAGSSSGGDFSLTSGFWFALLPGDCNDDGIVQLMDYEFFVLCLSGPNGGLLSDCGCFDVNRNSSVDLRDFAAITQGN